jgi:hypothetical protein
MVNMIPTNMNRCFRQRVKNLSAAVAVALTLLAGQAASWAGQPGSPAGAAAVQAADAKSIVPQEQTSSPISSTDETGRTYASREAAAKTNGLENFKGGDVVIVGAGGLIVVLLIILIIVAI